jgi:RNA polymerase sigma-70 factor (ECF subfamily)
LTYQSRAGNQTADIDEVNEADLVVRDDERPDVMAQRGETFRALEDGLRALPSQQRMVFILRELQGLSYGEIADVLGMNEQAARTNLCRAKRRLQVWLDPLLV